MSDTNSRPWLLVADGSPEPNEAQLQSIDYFYKAAHDATDQDLVVEWDRGGITVRPAEEANNARTFS